MYRIWTWKTIQEMLYLLEYNFGIAESEWMSMSADVVLYRFNQWREDKLQSDAKPGFKNYVSGGRHGV